VLVLELEYWLAHRGRARTHDADELAREQRSMDGFFAWLIVELICWERKKRRGLKKTRREIYFTRVVDALVGLCALSYFRRSEERKKR
jgi:hypothetical protein